ncbi:AmmeMemoRadiSam system protein B [Telmatospirillum siberiense]|uniref:MEMO1 family protein CWS72_02780 n=1 Tax=Telmatospirillum siberiense TaxID=382514 RepID=A0A2N3Q0A0_9PROT|nr:AmmeMemoRadiSam system protein B [Telmatospirillum siberiense]PKU26075.1 extradiol dioxygenase [Telmatospirillum siberiense]
MSLVRHAAVAGMFYAADPAILAGDVRRFLDGAPAKRAEEADAPFPKAIIAPHAGYVYSGPIAASVYARIKEARREIRRVVLFGPSHRVAFPGLAVPSVDFFETPLGRVPLDRQAIGGLLRLQGVATLDAAHAQEHSLEVHLPFLQTVLDDFTLIPVVVGDASPELVAAAMEALWGGNETLVVVSSDLSHYHDYDHARQMDGTTSRAIERLDLGAIAYDQACGRTPIAGLLLEARRHGLTVETLDLRNSGDTAGPRDRVVGYGGWIFRPKENLSGTRDQQENGAATLRRHAPLLLALARQSINARLNGQDCPRPQGLPAFLDAPGASFVTLKKHGDLRGCIGSAVAWRPLADDILDNATAAAFRDPRFTPLSPAEWGEIELSLSVLTPPEPIRFTSEADLLAQLRPREDGLIIEDGTHRALFLPIVWEMLPDPKDFLHHLKRKAGLPDHHWSHSFTARRFHAVEFDERPDS